LIPSGENPFSFPSYEDAAFQLIRMPNKPLIDMLELASLELVIDVSNLVVAALRFSVPKKKVRTARGDICIEVAN
jgi:hypothetical protein